MKLGLIARADNSGLGMQTWEFYRHMHPDKVMVVDISKWNNNKQYPERYGDTTWPHEVMHVEGTPTPGQIDTWLEGLDCVFVAEAPYNFYLYARAKELGIKVAVQYNYEFFDWFAYPHYPMPDMLVAPSRWHYEQIQEFCDQHGIEHIYLHCPVDRKKLPFTPRTQARKFLHLVGRSAAHDRNGTEAVISAAAYVQSDVEITLHFQGEQGLPHQVTNTIDDYKRMIEIAGAKNIVVQQKEFANYEDIYKGGYDVMLLPRRYGGNCLPLNEALSTGMPVLMPDISPNNFWLPPDWLLPAETFKSFTPRTEVAVYNVRPADLAAKIDYFADLDTDGMKTQSYVADALAKQIDWELMAEMYRRILENLCNLK